MLDASALATFWIVAFTAAISSDIDPVVSRMKARSTSRVGGKTRFTASLRSMTPSLCASENRVLAEPFWQLVLAERSRPERPSA